MDYLRLLRSCPAPAPEPATTSFEAWLATAFPGFRNQPGLGSSTALRSEKPPEIVVEIGGEFAASDGGPHSVDDRPALPPGESYERNARKAQAWGKQLPEGFVLLYLNVRNRAPMDYKQRGARYQDAGNYNFGYVTAAMGLPVELALRGAGWAQERAGTSRPEYGSYLGDPPYGDDPRDQEQIRRGYDAYFRDHPDEKLDVSGDRKESWGIPRNIPLD